MIEPSDFEVIRRVSLEVIDERFDSAAPDWWPNTEEWADEIARRLTDAARSVD